MFWVYVIQSQKDKKFYTGITKDVERRLSEHNLGKHSTPSTLNRGPFVLVYKESFLARKEAREMVKKWCRKGVEIYVYRNSGVAQR